MMVIVDYGLGNLVSVEKAVKRMTSDVIISGEAKVIEQASKLILPGVGHFSKGMENLKNEGLIPLLNKKVQDEQCPILGICLGMQLLMDSSDEGNVAGLGWIKGKSIRFEVPEIEHLKIPHLGWNNVALKDGKHVLFQDILPTDQFYFAHSYHAAQVEPKHMVAQTTYGSVKFTSAIQRENVFGVQFHPEKSHDQGMKLLKNFIELNHV